MSTTVFRSIESVAREHAESAMDTIVDVMTDPWAENKDRLNAAKEVLDRAYGKPTSTVVTLPPNARQRQQAAKLTDEQLMEIIDGEVLPQLEAPAAPAARDTKVPAHVRRRIAGPRPEADLSDPAPADDFDEEVDPLCL